MKAIPIYKNGEIVQIRFESAFDERKAMRLISEDDVYYASKYTDKPYVNYLEWHYNEENAQVVMDYIKDHLKDRFTLRLYNTWESDDSPATVKKVPLDELTIEDIKWIWGRGCPDGNECLLVFKRYI
jgi:hypothetical protein